MPSRSAIMKKIWAKRSKAEKRRLMNKIRKKWISMSSTARQKAMPPKLKAKAIAKLKREGRFYPVGQYVTIDVGRPKHTYIITKKTKYGWTPAKKVTYEQLKRKIAHARKIKLKKLKL